MTRKDYKALANILFYLLRENTMTRGGFEYLCSQLDTHNANFNRAQFEKACGYVPTSEELN